MIKFKFGLKRRSWPRLRLSPSRQLRSIGWLLLVSLMASYLALGKTTSFQIKNFKPSWTYAEGLDLAGGTRLIYDAKTESLDNNAASQAMTSLKLIIENRVNGLGVTEPLIITGRSGDKRRLTVELPGIDDLELAKNLIGQTAKLQFATNFSLDEQGNIVIAENELVLSGQDLARADVTFDQQSQSPYPQIRLRLSDGGAAKFTAATAANIGKPIFILLDNSILSAPTVQSKITGNEAVITGSFTIPEAKQLVNLLNGGALPVGIELVEQAKIGASLGQDALHKSLRAGLIGYLAISILLIWRYRQEGVVAIFSLGLYTLITLAIFKLIPITLTLASISGLILSIGMAVDANILIYERMREERRNGLKGQALIDQSFKRAWSSIRDSNVTSLISAAILLTFGSTLIKGFALTLGIGIVVSMFTAITVTRTILSLTQIQQKRARG